jgi:hypothetical protein
MITCQETKPKNFLIVSYFSSYLTKTVNSAWQNIQQEVPETSLKMHRIQRNVTQNYGIRKNRRMKKGGRNFQSCNLNTMSNSKITKSGNLPSQAPWLHFVTEKRRENK